jgi:nucleoside-diphosphate-sugar epimerase
VNSTFITWMKNYLIIGYGWLGKALSLALKEDGANVYSTSTDENKLNEMLSDGIYPVRLMKIDQIVSWEETPSKFFDAVIITFPPFAGVLESLQNLVSSIKADLVIFTSSTGVYLDESRVMDESAPVSTSHLVFQMEECIRALVTGKYIILRLAGHVGPNRHPVRFFLRHKRDISNGQAPVNLIHQSDIIAAIMCILAEPKQDEIYNVCWPEHPTKEEYYGKIAGQLTDEKLVFLEGNHGKKIEGSKINRHTRFVYAHSIHGINDLDLKKDNI